MDLVVRQCVTVRNSVTTSQENVLDSATPAGWERTARMPVKGCLDLTVRRHATAGFNVIAKPASVLLGGVKLDGKEPTVRHLAMMGCMAGAVGHHVTARFSVMSSMACVLVVIVAMAGSELTVSKPAMLGCGDRAVPRHATASGNVITSTVHAPEDGVSLDGREQTASNPATVGCMEDGVRRNATVRNSVTTSQENVLDSARLAGRDLTVKYHAKGDLEWAVHRTATVRFSVIESQGSVLSRDVFQDGKALTVRHLAMVLCMAGAVRHHVTVRSSVTTFRASVLLDSVTLAMKEQNAKVNVGLVTGDRTARECAGHALEEQRVTT